jgi:restriction endonuclease S subunit
MSAEYPRLLLGDLIIHQKGFAFKSVDYQKNGIPVVRVSNFTDNSIDTSDLKYVSEKIGRDNYKVALNTNDVVIATVGSWPKNPASIVGKTICVPSEMNGALMNQNSVILRVKNNCPVDQKYLFIALKTKPFSEYLVSTAQGSANQASVTLGDIFSYEVEWPEPEIRKLIVSVVDSMNQKIQLNRKINQNLEAMAQAIFQSWFVDFDPVKAKIAACEQWQILTDDERTEWLNELLNTQGSLKTCLLDLTAKAGLRDAENVQLKSRLDLISCRGHGPEGPENIDIGLNNLRKEWQSKISGPALQSASETLYLNIAAMTAISSRDETSLADMPTDEFSQLYKTASLFPERLVESELGVIPEGWSVGKLGDLIEFNPRRTLKKGTLAPYLDMKNVPTSGHLADEVLDRELGSGTKFINGDTLLARITPCLENGKTAFVDFLEDNQVGWGSTEYIIMRPKANYPVSLGYFIARNEEFRQHAVQSMTGTSGRQRANSKALEGLDWLVYPIELLLEFDKLSGHYLKVARTNGDQNKSLSMIRDSLLPKLLSGELEI